MSCAQLCHFQAGEVSERFHVLYGLVTNDALGINYIYEPKILGSQLRHCIEKIIVLTGLCFTETKPEYFLTKFSVLEFVLSSIT